MTYFKFPKISRVSSQTSCGLQPVKCCVTTGYEIHYAWCAEIRYMHFDQNHTFHFELHCTTNQKQNESCPLLGFILACSRNSFVQVNQLRKLHSARYHTRKWRNNRLWCESLRRRPLCPQTRSKRDRDDQLHPARRCHSLQDLRLGFLRSWARSCARTELWCLPRTRVDLPPQERSPGGICVHHLHLRPFSKRSVEARCGLERSEWQIYNLRQNCVGAGVNLNEQFQGFR